ncbi:MAG: diadenylate cyclase [Planctomycetes bacterium]|nr:diadenylate cyclase [Planctomycetota bacterium]
MIEIPKDLHRPESLFEVAVMATAIYAFLRFLHSTRGSVIARGLVILTVLVFGAILVFTTLFQLPVLAQLLQFSLPTILLIFVVIFHPELRRGISRLGENPLLRRFAGTPNDDPYTEIVRAVSRLARERAGALIAFEREFNLDPYVEGGVRIEARVHHLLVEAIFQPDGPLHDGALIVRRNRLEAAACLFPLTENPDLSKRMGTRHRAAIGLSEETDAVVLVVSAERGEMALCHHGELMPNLSVSELETRLRALMQGGSSHA